MRTLPTTSGKRTRVIGCNLFCVILRATRTSHVAAKHVTVGSQPSFLCCFLIFWEKKTNLNSVWNNDSVEKRENTCTRTKQLVEENERIIGVKRWKIDENTHHSLNLIIIRYNGNIRYDNLHHFSFFDSDFGRQGFHRRRYLNVLIVRWSFILFGLQSKESEFSRFKWFHSIAHEQFNKPAPADFIVQSILFFDMYWTANAPLSMFRTDPRQQEFWLTGKRQVVVTPVTDSPVDQVPMSWSCSWFQLHSSWQTDVDQWQSLT